MVTPGTVVPIVAAVVVVVTAIIGYLIDKSA